jgi:ATP-dependent protease HslVU (ClpYQ) peptidase subunit
VTVCIAAVCQQDDKPRIVTCIDWNQETLIAQSETADKFRVLPKGWIALMAGTLSRAEDLVAHYETKLRVTGTFEDDRDLFAAMKEPAFQHKHALADEYIKQLLGISYQEFLNNANTLPQEFVAEKLKDVSAIKLGAAVILAGFVKVANQGTEKEPTERLPYLFVVDDQDGHQDVVRVENEFAVIGSGSYVAIPALNQREQDSEKTLMETIYAVFEAKRLAEVVPGVGKMTSLEVIEPDRKWTLSQAGYDRCDEVFRQIGPKVNLTKKTANKLFEMQTEYLEPFDDETD